MNKTGKLLFKILTFFNLYYYYYYYSSVKEMLLLGGLVLTYQCFSMHSGRFKRVISLSNSFPSQVTVALSQRALLAHVTDHSQYKFGAWSVAKAFNTKTEYLELCTQYISFNKPYCVTLKKKRKFNFSHHVGKIYFSNQDHLMYAFYYENKMQENHRDRNTKESSFLKWRDSRSYNSMH